MNIGQRIIELREEKKWNTVDLAEQSGVSQPTISKIESGKTSPRLDSLLKIARAFEISLVELLPLEAHIGKSNRLPTEELEIIELIYKLSPEERTKLLEFLHVLVNREKA